MRIIELRASNVKALKAITIRPDGDVVTISGKNGAGKSSVLDAIWYALGGKGAIPGEPIRRGETAADIRLDLGDLVVTRRITEKSTSLTVRNQDGATYPSPQAMLDGLLSRFAFDPWAFARMGAREQRAALLELLGLDTSEIDAQYKAAYEQRREEKRALQSAEQAAGAARAAAPAEDPGEERSQQQLETKLNLARAHQHRIDEADREAKDAEHAVGVISRRIDAIKAELRAEEEKLARAFNVKVDAIQALKALPAAPDIDAILAEMESINDHNERAKAWHRAETANQVVTIRKAAVEQVETAMRELLEQKAALLKSVTMPLDGLTIDDECLRFNSHPLSQCSAAERLRVAAAICMAGNPKLTVMRIEDGSLLDTDSLAMLEQMAREYDFQIWLERVDTSGEVGILIEDGEIRNDAASAA